MCKLENHKRAVDLIITDGIDYWIDRITGAHMCSKIEIFNDDVNVLRKQRDRENTTRIQCYLHNNVEFHVKINV